MARRTSTTGVISIHALLAESDNTGQPVRGLPSNFYPRSPCGERLYHNTRLLSNHTFLSTLSLRRATPRRPAQQQKGQFLSTLSLRRATFNPHFFRPARTISIHALLAESDCWGCDRWKMQGSFLSTLSLRRATACSPTISSSARFLSTLSLRRATRLFLQPYGLPPIFLSTLSLRRATSRLALALITSKHFYPRSPCGERRNRLAPADVDGRISIHALLAESDPSTNGTAPIWHRFLSTLSLRRATNS